MDTKKATIPEAENIKAIESHEKAAQNFQDAAKYYLVAAKISKAAK